MPIANTFDLHVIRKRYTVSAKIWPLGISVAAPTAWNSLSDEQ